MADDVEDVKNKSVETKPSDEDNSLETELKFPKTNCEDNGEESGGEIQGDIPQKENCVEEKQTKTSENEVAILFANVQEKNDEDLFQDLGVPTEENTSVEVKADDPEVEKAGNTEDKDDIKDDSREELSFAHDTCTVESENMSTHPPADSYPEGTEFRHRNVAEKTQNIEEIPTDQLTDQIKDAMKEQSTTETSRTDHVEEEITFSNVENRELTDQQTSPKSM